jgi:hypothetical protein
MQPGHYVMIKYNNGNRSRSVFPLSKVKVTSNEFRPILVQANGAYNQAIFQNNKGVEYLHAFCLLQRKRKNFVVMNIVDAIEVCANVANSVESMSGLFRAHRQSTRAKKATDRFVAKEDDA